MSLHPHTRQRQRKLLLIFGGSLLSLGLIAYLLYRQLKPADPVKQPARLNTHLPLAHLSEKKEPSKFGLYQLLGRDTSRSTSWPWTDTPTGRSWDLGETVIPTPVSSPPASSSKKRSVKKPPITAFRNAAGDTDSTERLFNERIHRLQELIRDRSNRSPVPEDNKVQQEKSFGRVPESKESAAASIPAVDDPEMDQLNAMLDKVLAIQHPERQKTGSVHLIPEEKPLVMKASFTDELDDPTHFYNLETMATAIDSSRGTAAAIAGTQTLISGERIQLTLRESVLIDGIRVPAGTLIWGTGRLSQERLKIQVGAVVIDGNIYPVSMSVYDLDGLEGIQIPNSMTREASKESTSEALSGLGMAGLDPSLGAQAASAGIQTARSLIGKSVKAKRVTLPAGYQVILINKK